MAARFADRRVDRTVRSSDAQLESTRSSAPGIYMVRHLDFHFYVITPAEQQMVQGGPVTPKLYRRPTFRRIMYPIRSQSRTWACTGLTRRLGNSTVNRSSERLFTGSYHGQLTFLEPMVTQAFMQTHSAVEMKVKQPQAFQRSGFYPMRYSIRYDARNSVLRVSLDSLTAR
jgi:hypothetical protein